MRVPREICAQPSVMRLADPDLLGSSRRDGHDLGMHHHIVLGQDAVAFGLRAVRADRAAVDFEGPAPEDVGAAVDG